MTSDIIGQSTKRKETTMVTPGVAPVASDRSPRRRWGCTGTKTVKHPASTHHDLERESYGSKGAGNLPK